MTFDEVLHERLQGDDGVLLRVSAYQRMMETDRVARGESAPWLARLRRRSRMITTKGRAVWLARWKG